MSSDDDDDYSSDDQTQRRRAPENSDQVSAVLSGLGRFGDGNNGALTEDDMEECNLNSSQVSLCNSECLSSNFGYNSASNTSSTTGSIEYDSINNNGRRKRGGGGGVNDADINNGSNNNDNDDDNPSFKNMFTNGDLPIGLGERIRFALIWGLNLAQQDFEKYLLYFLLTRVSSPPCDYVSVYSLWILVASIIAYPVNVLSGWLTDYLSSYQNHVLQASLVLQTGFFWAMFGMLLRRNGFWAQVFYQLRQAAMVQSMTSVWKLIKIRLDVETQRSWARNPAAVKVGRLLDTENVVVSGIGNTGDLVSEVVEVLALVVFYTLTEFLSVRKVGVSMFVTAASLNIIPMVLSLSISRKDLTVPTQNGYRCIPDEYPPQGNNAGHTEAPAEHNRGITVEDTPLLFATPRSGSNLTTNYTLIQNNSSSAPYVDSGYISSNDSSSSSSSGSSSGSNSNNSSGNTIFGYHQGSGGGSSSSGSGSSYGGMGVEDELGAQILADDDFVAPEPEYYGKHGAGRLYHAWEWVWKRLRYIATTHAVRSTMLHSLLATFLYYYMTYPVTVLINTEDSDGEFSSSDNSGAAHPSNFCHMTLVNLLRQGAILMVCYSVLSLIYMAVLVRCPPRRYYTFVLPFLSALTALSLLVILLLKGSIKKYVLNFVISLAQIIPYYINAYSYYVLNTSIRQDYYGFVQAFYAFCIQAALISTSFSLYYSVPEVILVIVCLLLIIFTALLGFAMRWIFLNPHWAEDAKRI